MRAVRSRTVVAGLLLLVCTQACAWHKRSGPRPDHRTQVVGATVEARDPALAAVLMRLTLAPSAAQHRAVANEYRRLGILDTAFDHLTAATRLDPRDAAAYDARARIWRDWGYPGMGMPDAARAIYFAPRSAPAHNTFGTLLAAAGLTEQARHQFHVALSLDPEAEFARTNLRRLDAAVRTAADRPR